MMRRTSGMMKDSTCFYHTMPQSEPYAPSLLEGLQQPAVIIGIWITGEALACILALAPGNTGERLIVFGIASLLIQWVALFTLLAMHLGRRWLQRWPVGVQLGVALLTMVASTGLAQICFMLLFGSAAPYPSLAGALPGILNTMGIAFIAGLLGLVAIRNHLRVQALSVRALRAELEALQARTHPHFLFNTLNVGAALVHRQPDATERLLLDLADLFRASLQGQHEMPLEEEIELARRYLAIEQLRLGPRLDMEWRIEPALPSLRLPTLCLQALVENAIRHGVEPRTAASKVVIEIARYADGVRIAVSNDTLPRQVRPDSRGHGIGQSSIRRRISDVHPCSHLHIDDCDERYTVTIDIPLQAKVAPSTRRWRPLRIK